jgi:zinc transport system substrate-binding protein
VTVSIFPVYDLVRRIAGPDAEVSLVLQPGHDAHAYAPTPKDVDTVRGAKLGVVVGLGLDPWMEKLLTDAAPTARVLKVADRVPTRASKEDPDGAEDPHVWLDPQRAQLIARALAEELGRVDGAHALAYRARATALDAALVGVDKEAEDRLKALHRRSLVTLHGSFGYLAERYKLSVIGVIEPQPGTPDDPEHMAKVRTAIRDAIRDNRAPAVFGEPEADARPAKELAAETRISYGVLDPIGGGAETDSYEKLIRFDVAQLEKNLD